MTPLPLDVAPLLLPDEPPLLLLPDPPPLLPPLPLLVVAPLLLPEDPPLLPEDPPLDEPPPSPWFVPNPETLPPHAVAAAATRTSGAQRGELSSRECFIMVLRGRRAGPCVAGAG
jgi:hypothetical protein